MKRGIFTSLKSVLTKLTGPRKRLNFIRRTGVSPGIIVELDAPESQEFQSPPREEFEEFLLANPHQGPNQIPSAKDDFRVVFEPVRIGPQSVEEGSVAYQALHRVGVRGVLEAADTVESLEMSFGELDLLNTTHSSYIDSEVLSND